MGGSAWEGHATLKAALDGLATAKGVSANRVKAVASAAFQYAKDYKRVVHDVEIFLWKAEVEHRLAGLYAMDAIMRQSQAKLGNKDPFVKRFLLHLTNTITAVKKIPSDQHEHVRRVVEEWQTRGYYTAQDIEQAGGHEFSINNAKARRPSSAAAGGDAASSSGMRASPAHADPASKDKLASLLSIIKKQKELKEQQGTEPPPQAPLLSQPPLLPTPSSQRARLHESPHRRQSLEDRPPLARASEGYSRDQGAAPSRDHRSGQRDRDRKRSRSRSRDRGAHAPRDRSRDRSHSQRDTGSGDRDRRPSSPARDRERQDSAYDRRDSFEDSRDAKKPRSSRWGPPPPPSRPSETGGRDDNRPPVIDTRDHERSTRFESRSPPRNRYDGPPGGAAPLVPATGQGSSWPPTGYQGPPPPALRSGPPPLNAFPPVGAGNGLMPPPRGGPLDWQPPVSGGHNAGYSQPSQAGNLYNGGGPPGPLGPRGPAGPDQFRRNEIPSQSGALRAGMPDNAGTGDQPSREVCRKFIAGRCTFGDRCWHVHNPNGTTQQDGGGQQTHPFNEMNQARRKTVLCANFPQGNCRFGDRCSFAHGEEDLDKSSMRRPPPLMTQDPMRGGPSPRGSSSHGAYQPQQQPQFQQQQPQFQRQSPAVSPHQPHANTAAAANAYSRSPAGMTGPPRPHFGAGPPPSIHAAMASEPPQSVGGNSQWTGAAAASAYGGYAPTGQAPLLTPTNGTGALPSTAPASNAVPRDRAPSRDDDEVEAAAAPEFTLQYDEDD